MPDVPGRGIARSRNRIYSWIGHSPADSRTLVADDGGGGHDPSTLCDLEYAAGS
jgi:hypothetical protein